MPSAELIECKCRCPKFVGLAFASQLGCEPGDRLPSAFVFPTQPQGCTQGTGGPSLSSSQGRGRLGGLGATRKLSSKVLKCAAKQFCPFAFPLLKTESARPYQRDVPGAPLGATWGTTYRFILLKNHSQKPGCFCASVLGLLTLPNHVRRLQSGVGLRVEKYRDSVI